MGVWESREFDAHEQVCFFTDLAVGLRAIVAIHSTALGPAVGGTRFKAYACDADALDDALRLSRAMSYKAALAGLPSGGGKAVIIGNPAELKSSELLESYARFINRIGQSFATGEDVGISMADAEAMRKISPFVGGTASAGEGDPSAHTATGVLHGLRAVVERQFSRSDFRGLRVAIQGLGAVGWGVAERLHTAGAELIVADVRPEVVARAERTFGADTAPTERIHAAPADIFCPCALGGVITDASALEIQARAVAGAANNQLASPAAGQVLADREVLYAPDYVINAGGVISGLKELRQMPGRELPEPPPLEERLALIYDRLKEIFRRAADEDGRPELTAEALAREIIRRDAV